MYYLKHLEHSDFRHPDEVRLSVLIVSVFAIAFLAWCVIEACIPREDSDSLSSVVTGVMFFGALGIGGLLHSRHQMRKEREKPRQDLISKHLAACDVFDGQGKPHKSAEELSKAILLDPHDIWLYAHRARTYLKLGHNDKAFKDCDTVISLAPFNPNAYKLRADAYRQEGYNELALADLTKARWLDFRSGAPWRRDEDIEELRGKPRQKPTDVNPTKIIRDTTKAINSGNNSIARYRERARAHIALGQLQQAADDYTEAISLHSQFGVGGHLYQERGDIFRQLGEDDKAELDYSTANRLTEESLDKSIEGYARYAEQGSIYHLEKRAELYARRGQLREADNDYERAINLYTEQINLAPEDSENYVGRAQIYQKLKLPKMVLKDLTMALSLDPEDSGLFRRRGQLHMDLQMYQEAIDDFSDAIDLGCCDARVYQDRAIAFAKAGHHQNAIDDCSVAIARNPDNADLYLLRGDAYHAMGKDQQAINDYKNAMAEPSRVDVFAHERWHGRHASSDNAATE